MKILCFYFCRGASIIIVKCQRCYAIALGLFFLKRETNSTRPRNAELAYSKEIVDIESMKRSEAQTEAGKPIYLQRKPLELTIRLPVGSKAGSYEFQLQRSQQVVVSTNAQASIRDGTTEFTVRIDLSALDVGIYSMSVRRVPWDWNYFPVVIR